MTAPSGQTATARIQPKKQTLEDAYSPPANFLEIDILDPQTHGLAKKRYTDYEVRMRVRKRHGTSTTYIALCFTSLKLL